MDNFNLVDELETIALEEREAEGITLPEDDTDDNDDESKEKLEDDAD